ncbi:MAG: mechanosensitive ion channel family protein [Bacteroidales bacterium]|nr:mechanosensitive ion channel family protein [Bacteroidales bacterium]
MVPLIIPSHRLANLILHGIDWTLRQLGLRHSQTIEEVIYTVLITLIAMGLGWLARKIVVWIARKLLLIHKSAIDQDMLNQKIFSRCSHMIPPLVFLAMIPFAFETDPKTLHVIEKVVIVYSLITIGVAANAVLTFIWSRYDQRENNKNHPLRGILNVAQGIVWIVVVIISVSVVIDKSPAYLLTGLGAFAAALMLIFKDSILGLVAAVQLSQNDMLRLGDWIVVPNTPANGTVIDVSLTVVKVKNWDNTVVMLPPYTLVSTSFQNWRGMVSSGARRICRQVIVDNYTITPLTPALIEQIVAKYPEMKDYVNAAKGVPTKYNGATFGVNGTMETNLGLFRAYMCVYLTNHPEIAHDQQLLVRLMEADENGTPLQIYVFTSNINWTAYEAIQSEIFEHIAVASRDFGLSIYNTSDGSDIIVHQGPPEPSAPDTPDTP